MADAWDPFADPADAPKEPEPPRRPTQEPKEVEEIEGEEDVQDRGGKGSMPPPLRVVNALHRTFSRAVLAPGAGARDRHSEPRPAGRGLLGETFGKAASKAWPMGDEVLQAAKLKPCPELVQK